MFLVLMKGELLCWAALILCVSLPWRKKEK